MSIRPRHDKNILNGIKLWEIRKKFPSDYVGWVYIYCTKEDSLGRIKDTPHDRYFVDCVDTPQDFEKMDSGYDGKGKVIARFWCDKVEEHRPFFHWCIEKETCLTRDDVLDYLDSKDKFVGNPKRQDKVYAIHITKLEIFDKPKEISEFKKCYRSKGYPQNQSWYLTRAPQSYCYIEV